MFVLNPSMARCADVAALRFSHNLATHVGAYGQIKDRWLPARAMMTWRIRSVLCVKSYAKSKIRQSATLGVIGVAVSTNRNRSVGIALKCVAIESDHFLATTALRTRRRSARFSATVPAVASPIRRSTSKTYGGQITSAKPSEQVAHSLVARAIER